MEEEQNRHGRPYFDYFEKIFRISGEHFSFKDRLILSLKISSYIFGILTPPLTWRQEVTAPPCSPLGTPLQIHAYTT